MLKFLERNLVSLVATLFILLLLWGIIFDPQLGGAKDPDPIEAVVQGR